MGGPERNRSTLLVNNTPSPQSNYPRKRDVGRWEGRGSTPGVTGAEALHADIKATGTSSCCQSQERTHLLGTDPHMHYSWVCDYHKSLRNVTLNGRVLERKELSSGKSTSHGPGGCILAKSSLPSSRSPLALTGPLSILT